MLVPLSWLAEYVALPSNVAELIERLTLAGLEVIGTRVLGRPVPAGLVARPSDVTPEWERDKVVVARVLVIEKHPDADKLKLVTLDHGAAERKIVVTGATNIALGESGMKVVLGLRGTRYFLADKEGGKKIAELEPKALRGIMNDAMCMSNFELGIAEDHEGIIILDECDPPPGTPVQDFLSDIVVEIDVLPNMARCLGMQGIAREVAAITGGKLHSLAMDAPRAGEPADACCQVAIEDPSLSARYIAMVARGMTVRPAPRWMRHRLLLAGIRPINNIVDITNYVMLETGQPLHAFDYDQLRQRARGGVPQICVRPARPGEKLVTLDGVERTLDQNHLVIADALGPIALAGVMGGRETEVTANTRSILLEAAQFDFVSIRKTSRQFNLFSEASTRFSRSIHPDLAAAAALRAIHLLHTHAGGEVLPGWVDCYPNPMPPQSVDLNRNDIERLLGTTMPDGEVERILTALDFQITPTLWGWTVLPPANRLDIQCGAADLIEDLARISGYDRLPERLAGVALQPPRLDRNIEYEEFTRDRLVAAGLMECIHYALVRPEAAAENAIQVVNPISPERSVLRTSLLPGLLETARRHLEYQGSAALFEIGPVFLPRSSGLPDEPRRLAMLLAGQASPIAWDRQHPAPFDFFDLKGIIESLLADLCITMVAFQQSARGEIFHPARSADCLVQAKLVGTFGELHPRLAEGYQLPQAFAAEIDLDLLLAAVPSRIAYQPFSLFPPAKRDLAVVLPQAIPAGKVRAEILAAGRGLLVNAELFDVYEGGLLPAGTRSLAFALTYQAVDRTLDEKEILKAHERLEDHLRKVFDARIRGKDLP